MSICLAATIQKSIKIVHELGYGVQKKTYLGVYGDGIRVAVKMLQTRFASRDQLKSSKMFMKEILLLMELKHKSIIKLLGFCIRGDRYGTESLKDGGIIAVYEYGEEVSLDRLIKLPLSQRLDLALELLDLMVYLDRSPLGSLLLINFKLCHFLMRENSLKLIDVNVDRDERFCRNEAQGDVLSSNMSTVSGSRCIFDLPCQNGRCVGYNAKNNLLTVNEVLLRHLLHNFHGDNLKQDMDGYNPAEYVEVKDLEKAKSVLSDNRHATADRVRQLLLSARSFL